MINKKWDIILEEELKKDYFKKLGIFVESEYKQKQIFPPYENIFDALRREVWEETGLHLTQIQGEENSHSLDIVGNQTISISPFCITQNLSGAYSLLLHTFLCTAEEYSIAQIYSVLFTCSSVDGHLGCFRLLANGSNAALNIGTCLSV